MKEENMITDAQTAEDVTEEKVVSDPDIAVEAEALEEEPAAEKKVSEVHTGYEDTSASDEMGIIAADTKIVGDIMTGGHITIYGEVIGNITAKGNVYASGKIDGDISCCNLKLSNCSAKANIIVKESVAIDTEAKVEGKIICGNLSVDGEIKGNIDAKDSISIYKNAKVAGDIKSKSLGIEPGSTVQGNVMVVR